MPCSSILEQHIEVTGMIGQAVITTYLRVVVEMRIKKMQDVGTGSPMKKTVKHSSSFEGRYKTVTSDQWNRKRGKRDRGKSRTAPIKTERRQGHRRSCLLYNQNDYKAHCFNLLTAASPTMQKPKSSMVAGSGEAIGSLGPIFPSCTASA